MERRHLLTVLCTGLAGLLVTATVLCSQSQPQNPAPSLRDKEDKEEREDRERPARMSVRGTRGAVATGSDVAAEAGMRILHRGGNAVDAGVAALFAAAAYECSHFGFGGEAPILIRTKEGKVISLAGVGTMPAAATADFFRSRKLAVGEVQQLDPGGLKGMIPVAGLMPAIVPGMVDAGLVALKEYGTMSFAEVIAPALDVADGYPLDETRSYSIAAYRRFFDLWPTSKAHFFPEGRPYLPGEIFPQADLARTLRAMSAAESNALASRGGRTGAIDAIRDYFYRGDIARRIDRFVRENDGLLRYEDMAGFRVTPEEAVCRDYRGYQVCKPGFWSQGPVMLQTLEILQGIPLAKLGHNSLEYLHQMAEAMKLAYADRDTWYGDPKLVSVPARELLGSAYATSRRNLIGDRASYEFRPGNFGGRRALHPSQMEMARARIDDALMAKDTTCINVVDKDGVMFATTPSGAWLPPVMAGDTGIPLTQRAQSFLLIPGHPNELAPGKRPRVTLSPTLVTKDGKPSMTLATPGGDNQDQALLQVFLNMAEFQMSAEHAIEAPRIQTCHLVSSFDNHAMNPGDLLVDERIPQPIFRALTGRGHRTSLRSRWNSGANPVVIRVLPNGVLEAGADPWGYRVAQAW
ncbi:MAG: gamma-glutamyltransferase [Bryobacteraceae bacterium]|nr:gamma-glutamyltransferase [Bryobacteraceae bacterium]